MPANPVRKMSGNHDFPTHRIIWAACLRCPSECLEKISVSVNPFLICDLTSIKEPRLLAPPPESLTIIEL